MLVISRLFLIIGIIFICLSVVPFFTTYPLSDQVNMWETIVVTAHDTQIWFFILGILLVAGELVMIYQVKKHLQ